MSGGLDEFLDGFGKSISTRLYHLKEIDGEFLNLRHNNMPTPLGAGLELRQPWTCLGVRD